MIALLGSGGERPPRGTDPHTGRSYIVNRQAELVFRTPSLPVEALRSVNAR